MSEIYRQNLLALSNRFPEIAFLLADSKQKNYSTAESCNKMFPNLLWKGKDSEILFYDQNDPVYDALSYLEKGNFLDKRYLIILGFGLGYHIIELLKKNKKIQKLIVIEKDISCLQTALENVDMREIITNPVVDILAAVPENKLYEAIHKSVISFYNSLKEIVFVPHPPSILINGNYYKKVIKTFSHAVDIWIAERGNDPYDTLVAYEQFFQNIEYYLSNPSAGYIKDFFKGRPGIVVATGPSLHKSLHYLKEAEKSAVIVSADASFRILSNNNISPHFVTTVERPPGPRMFYKNISQQDNTILAVVSFAHPSTLEAYNGPKVLLHRHYAFMERMGLTEDCIQMGLSTANMAYEVARHLGCDPIILVGNDLAYDSSGNTHSKGFVHGERQEIYNDADRFEVPGNYENTVTTCNDWFKCIKTYEKRISGWKGTLINATAGGAKINGSVVMPFKDVLQTYCRENFNPGKQISDHMNKWKSNKTKSDFTEKLNEFHGYASWGVDMCSRMLDAVGPIIREAESSGGNLSPELKTRMKEALPNIEKILVNLEDSPLLYNFSEYFHTELIPLYNEWPVVNYRFRSEHWADAYRIKLIEELFGAVGQICLSLQNILDDAMKNLN